MFLLISDVWTHILNRLTYKDLYRLKCVNSDAQRLFQNCAIRSIVEAKYAHYQYIRQLFIAMVNDATMRGTVYFTVKDVNFKLYQNDVLFQDYSTDLHFNCTNQWDQDCVDVSQLSRQIRTAHSAPFSITDNLYIQIDPRIAKHLRNPEQVAPDEKHIYPVRKYPGSPLTIENEFTYDYEPFDNLWPLNTNEIKICESYDVSFEDFGQLLSKIYNRIEQCWIITSHHNEEEYRASLQKFADLFPYIFSDEMIRYKYEKYNEDDNFNVIKFAGSGR